MNLVWAVVARLPGFESVMNHGTVGQSESELERPHFVGKARIIEQVQGSAGLHVERPRVVEVLAARHDEDHLEGPADGCARFVDDADVGRS